MFSAIHIRGGHDNFFTPLRVLMALAVVIGHAFVVWTGNPLGEPRIFLDYTPSYTAVNAFFILSGFLVTKSMVARGDLPSYSAARILRIYPALAVHIFVVTFVIGAALTTLPLTEYLTHKDTLKQVPLVLSFINTDVYLPGVFDNNPEKYGSAALWTLRYELLAYIGTALLFVFGMLKRPAMIIGTFILCALAWSAAYRTGLVEHLPATLANLLRFGLAYSLGAAIFAVRDKINFYLWLTPVPFIIAWLFKGQPEAETFFNIALAYLIFSLAYIRLPRLEKLQNITDISYGVYIWHWVILQIIEHYFPESNAWQLALPAILISSLIAWASWHWIEEPALKKKRDLAAWFKKRWPGRLRAEAMGPAE